MHTKADVAPETRSYGFPASGFHLWADSWWELQGTLVDLQLVPFPPFFGEGSPAKTDYRKKGALILTSLLEKLGPPVVPFSPFFGGGCPY